MKKYKVKQSFTLVDHIIYLNSYVYLTMNNVVFVRSLYDRSKFIEVGKMPENEKSKFLEDVS